MTNSSYICGSNLHQQIRSGSDIDLFYTEPQLLHVQSANTKFFITWSQLWIVEDDEKLTCLGFHRENISSAISKLDLREIISVVPFHQSTLIESETGVHRVKEDGSVGRITLEGCQNNVNLLHGTESEVLGKCSKGQVFQGRLNNETLTFSLFDPVFSKEVKQVSCGYDHTLLLSTEGLVFTAGSNSRGQLGHGSISVDVVSSPQCVSTLEGINISRVAAGGWHSAAISDEGDLYVWGWNERGQLGLPCPNINRQFRKDTSNLIHLTEDLTYGEKSKLGNNFPLEIHQKVDPVLIQTLPYGLDLQDDITVKKIVCGSRHTCVLFDTGVVMSCGWNSYGQLGLADKEDYDFLKTVSYFIERDMKVVNIFAGAWNTVFLTQSSVT